MTVLFMHKETQMLKVVCFLFGILVPLAWQFTFQDNRQPREMRRWAHKGVFTATSFSDVLIINNKTLEAAPVSSNRS